MQTIKSEFLSIINRYVHILVLYSQAFFSKYFFWRAKAWLVIGIHFKNPRHINSSGSNTSSNSRKPVVPAPCPTSKRVWYPKNKMQPWYHKQSKETAKIRGWKRQNRLEKTTKRLLVLSCCVVIRIAGWAVNQLNSHGCYYRWCWFCFWSTNEILNCFWFAVECNNKTRLDLYHHLKILQA